MIGESIQKANNLNPKFSIIFLKKCNELNITVEPIEKLVDSINDSDLTQDIVEYLKQYKTPKIEEKIAKKVGTVYITVNTDSLRLREEPNTTSRTLTLLSRDAEYIALKEEEDFVEIQVDADLAGYVHKDYVQQRVEFEQAVSLEEEKQKKEEAEQRKKEADEAIAAMENLRKEAEQARTEPASETLDAAESTESIGMIAANPNETRAPETEAAFLEGESAAVQGAEAAAPAETGIAAGNRNGSRRKMRGGGMKNPPS